MSDEQSSYETRFIKPEAVTKRLYTDPYRMFGFAIVLLVLTVFLPDLVVVLVAGSVVITLWACANLIARAIRRDS